MTPNRRELLGSLGIASASTLLWALGCGGSATTARRPLEDSGAVRGWLRDAVAMLAGRYPSVHILAVSRRRTTAAIDVLGTGVARIRRDGVVITVRDPQGSWREQVTSDLDQAGIAAAVQALGGSAKTRTPVTFPPPPSRLEPPRALHDFELEKRLRSISSADEVINSRVVYAAAMIEIDDAHVWSMAPDHDREQRLVRVRQRATRAAWNGPRPVVSEAERGWIGGVDDQLLDKQAVEAASAGALVLVTPGGFEDQERTVILDPTMTAALVEAGARRLLTTTAARRPEVARRMTLDAKVGAEMLTLVDDPTAPGAYGGFQFDDAGVPAAPLTVIEGGRLAALLGETGRARRPGHVGSLAAAPSHLRVVPGTTPHEALRDEGLILEGARAAIVDPSTDRVVIGAARAREIKGGVDTGRVWAEVELVGSMAALLANITGIAKDTVTIPFRTEHGGEPTWRSVEAPHLRTTGVVRARRRRA